MTELMVLLNYLIATMSAIRRSAALMEPLVCLLYLWFIRKSNIVMFGRQ
jgi:hypothetical protein